MSSNPTFVVGQMPKDRTTKFFTLRVNAGADQASTMQVAVVVTQARISNSDNFSTRAAIEIQNALQVQSSPSVSRQLLDALQKANTVLYKIALDSKDDTVKDAATTAIAAAVVDAELYLAYAGNMQAYLLRVGHPQLYLLTVDPERSADRALGKAAHLPIDYRLQNVPATNPTTAAYRTTSGANVLALQPGDKLLFCPGSLADTLRPDRLYGVLMQKKQPQAAARELVRQGKTAIVTDEPKALVLWWDPHPVRHKVNQVIFALLALLLLAIVLVGGLYLFFPSVRQPVDQAIIRVASAINRPGASLTFTTSPATSPTTSLPTGTSSTDTPPPVVTVVVANAPITSTATIPPPPPTALPPPTAGFPPLPRMDALPPTVTLVPSATTAPTATPIPLPTNTPIPPATEAAIPTASSVAAPGNVSTTAPSELPSVRLKMPASGADLSGNQTFEWQPNFTLEAGEAFDVRIWTDNETPAQGRGIRSLTTNTSINVDLDALFTRGGIEEKGYHWGVFLVKEDSSELPQFLGGDFSFTYHQTRHDTKPSTKGQPAEPPVCTDPSTCEHNP
ncbi:MAG: hypothetical protein NT075_08340 [Chloroflexi bacterium]|nr:hypothetical protein [Chloroflexota bacterium]